MGYGSLMKKLLAFVVFAFTLAFPVQSASAEGNFTITNVYVEQLKEDIYFNVAFKPVATIMKEQKSVDRFGNTILIKGKGRHDPCVLPRAVPIVESMAALVMADFLLKSKTSKI